MAPWDIIDAVFSKSFQLPVASTSAYQDLIFRDDGVKMYTLTDGSGFVSNQSILREWDLSIPWDVSTATLTNTVVFSNENGGIFFKPDGTKMFITITSEGEINRFSLLTPWDISTLSFDTGKLVLFEDEPTDIFITSDGTQMFFTGFENGEVSQYTMSPPWTTVGAIRVAVKNISAQDPRPNGLWFKPDGTKMFVSGSVNGAKIYEYDLSTPFSILTAVFTQSFAVNTEDTQPAGVTFRNNNGLQMFFVGDTTEKVYAYVLGVDKTFSVGAKLVNEVIEFDMGAKVILRKIVEPTIGARLALFCDNIDTSSGWITTNGGGQILVDDPSFPNVIHFESMFGGGGVTERWTSKNTGLSLSGDIKLEFKFDFIAMGATDPFNAPSGFSIFLQEQNIHPVNSTGSRIGCVLAETENLRHHLYGVVTDGATAISSIQGGFRNQRTTHVYPPNQHGAVGIVEPSVLGPYWITVELKDNKFRMSLFLDESKTIHARGSPREVDATGINPANLQYLVIGNDKGQSSIESQTTADLDSICITKNEPIPLLAQNPTVATLIEDWEQYTTGDQNPDGWVSVTDPPNLSNTPFNVSSAVFNQGFTEIFGLLNNVGGMFIRKDTGQQLYVVNPSTRKINEFLLPTPWSLTGAVFNLDASIFSGSGGVEVPTGIHWKDNGFRVYTIDPNLSLTGTNDNMKEFFPQSGNAFDLSTGFGLVKEENTRDELNEGRTVGISLNPLGTRLYIVTQAISPQDITNGWTNSVHQYNMDIQPFNIGNRGLVVGSLAIGDGLVRPREMWMSDDGLKLIVIGDSQVNEYDLGTAFEINTAVFTSSRNLSPASFGRGVHMKPDGLKMFLSDNTGVTADQVFEYDIPTIFPPSIDIREVSTEQPNGGIKSFKLHTKFTGDGSVESMRSSVIGKRVATLPNPDGGELLIPLKFTAKARAEIMSAPSASTARGGVYITYELIEGAPLSQFNITRGLGFTMFKDNPVTGGPISAFNDIESVFAFMQNRSPETDSPEGSYFTLEANMKTIFQSQGDFDGQGLDFESHVKSISIGYWLDTSSGTALDDIEALMYGDEINLEPASTGIFTVNALIQQLGENLSCPLGISFLDDFSDDIGWITRGSGVSISGGTLNGWGTEFGVDRGITYDLVANDGFTVSDTDWVAEFDFQYNVPPTFIPSHVPFALADSALQIDPFPSPATPHPVNIRFRVTNTGPITALPLHKAQLEISDSTDSNNSATPSIDLDLFPNTTVYVRMSRVGGTTFNLEIYSDPARTIPLAGSPVQVTGVTTIANNLNFIHSSNLPAGGGFRLLDGFIDNLSILSGGGLTCFTVAPALALVDRIKEFKVDAFIKALGVNGNNGGTNPFVIQPIGDGFFTVPIGTLVGQRMTLPEAPTRIRQFTFVARRGGLTGAPVGTLVGKVRTNSTPNGRIGISDEIVTSINVVNIADITTDPAGEVITFDFDPEDPEITESEDVFIGFEVEGANDEVLIETISDPDIILGGDVVTEEDCAVETNLRSNRNGGITNVITESNYEIFPLDAGSSDPLPLGEVITHIRVQRGTSGLGDWKFRLAIYSGPGNGFTGTGIGATPLDNQIRATTAVTTWDGSGTGFGEELDIPLQGSYVIDSTAHNDIQVCFVHDVDDAQPGFSGVIFRGNDNNTLRKRISQTVGVLEFPAFPDNWLDNLSDQENEAPYFQLLGPNVTTTGDTCFTTDSGEDAVINITIDDEPRQRAPIKVSGNLTTGFKEKEFDLGAKVIIRQAVNCFCPNAILKALGQEKEFFINAILVKVGINSKFFFVNKFIKAFNQEKEFFINAVLVSTVPAITFIDAILIVQSVNQVEFFIDANVGVSVEKEEPFTISAVIGVSEPQSILDVESVIGHKAGLQS